MRKRIFVTTAFLLVTQGLGRAAIRLAPSEYPTIQTATDESNEGDGIIVGPSTLRTKGSTFESGAGFAISGYQH